MRPRDRSNRLLGIAGNNVFYPIVALHSVWHLIGPGSFRRDLGRPLLVLIGNRL